MLQQGNGLQLVGLTLMITLFIIMSIVKEEERTCFAITTLGSMYKVDLLQFMLYLLQNNSQIYLQNHWMPRHFFIYGRNICIGEDYLYIHNQGVLEYVITLS